MSFPEIRFPRFRDMLFSVNCERHPDAVADILLKSRRAGEALARMHHLRKPGAARVEPRPMLALRRDVLGDSDATRCVRIARDRQRAADQPRGLREQPARAAHLRLDDFADVDDSRTACEALRKPAADGGGKRHPLRLAHQRAEPQIADIHPLIPAKAGIQFFL
jgi:hypothetical protein